MKNSIVLSMLFFILFTSTAFSKARFSNVDSMLYEIKMLITEDVKIDSLELKDSMNSCFGDSYELKFVVGNDYCIITDFRRPPVLLRKSDLKWITYIKLIFSIKKPKMYFKYQFMLVQKKYDKLSFYWGEYHFDLKDEGPMYIISGNIIKIESVEEAKKLAESEWK